MNSFSFQLLLFLLLLLNSPHCNSNIFVKKENVLCINLPWKPPYLVMPKKCGCLNFLKIAPTLTRCVTEPTSFIFLPLLFLSLLFLNILHRKTSLAKREDMLYDPRRRNYGQTDFDECIKCNFCKTFPLCSYNFFTFLDISPIYFYGNSYL